ncbi:MAG: hypothetical protein WED33_10775 [Bacteroidia bacterium]
MRIRRVQHIIALLLFSAFANLWFPSELMHKFHGHKHTIHHVELNNEVTLDSKHHHCPEWNVSVIPYSSFAIEIARSFLRYKELVSIIILESESSSRYGKSYNRGPPEELV